MPSDGNGQQVPPEPAGARGLLHVIENKIPPGVATLVAAASMWVVASMTPIFDCPLPAQGLLATAGFAIGLGLVAAGVVSFRRAQTTFNPLKPETAAVLVITGIYSRTRNPMYLGVMFLLLGWFFVLANALAGLALPLLAGFLYRFQIQPEERALAAKFGEEFAAYRDRVPRWL